jgi:hypothetical protein
MPDTAALMRGALATGGDAGAWHALELALKAAHDAGRRVLRDNPHRPVAEQLALALQAADEALEGLALELAGDQGAGEGEG